jgi:hypothetical protein
LHAVAERYLRGDCISWESLFPPGWDAGLEDAAKDFIPFAANEAITRALWEAVPGIKVEEPIALLVGREFVDERGMPLLARPEPFTDKEGVRRMAPLRHMFDGSPLPRGYDRLPPLIGFIDLANLQLPTPRVTDHKTSRNRKYATTKAKLEINRQITCYGAWALAIRKDAQEFEGEHISLLKDLTAPEPAFSTKHIFPLEVVRQRWLEVIQIAEDMQGIRRKLPVVVDLANPHNRLDGFRGVHGAVDDGPKRAKESCNAFGRCPLYSACHGQSPMAEVVKRIDTPSMMGLIRTITAPTPHLTFGLNFHSSIPTTKDTHMPFAPAGPITHNVGSDVYIIDETDKSVQFRARILARLPNGKSAVGLWPHPDIEPHWPALPAIYKVDLDPATFFATPAPNSRIGGYQAELVNAKVPDENAWYDTKGNLNAFPEKGAPTAPAHPSPLTGHTGPAAAPTAADGFQDVKLTRPPRDPASSPLGTIPLVHSPGISVTMTPPPPPAASKGQALATQMQAAVAAEAANQVPPPNFEPKIGDVVEFLPAPAHRFWTGFAGKHATVTDVSLGQDQLIVSVSCEGVEYPDLQSGRFKLVSRPTPVPAKPADSPTHERMRQASSALAQSSTATATSGGPVPGAVPVPQQTVPGVSLLPPTLEAAQALVGKSVVFQAAGAAPFNAPLTAVSDVGPTLMGYTHPWDTVVRLSLLTPTDIPGAKPLKLTAAQKKEAAAKEEADAAYAQRHLALAKAHELAAAVVKGDGKATKKAFETILEHLIVAVAYQTEISGGAPAPAPAASPGTPEMAAALQAARDNIDLVAAQLGLA